MKRINTIRRRMGWQPGIWDGEGGKPKGMHWRTFERLKREYDAVAKLALAVIGKRLGLIDRQLAAIGLESGDDLVQGG